MTILEQALSKINGNKRKKAFFIILVQSLIGCMGKRTFRNLARYSQITEHTFARQMSKSFDFAQLNVELIKFATTRGDVLFAAQDATFVKKSGKKTDGLDYHWNGSAGRPEKGLEVDNIAVVVMNGDTKYGCSLSARQTPSNSTEKTKKKKKDKERPTKIDFYVAHVTEVMPSILALGIKHIVADSFFAKIKYIKGVIALGLHAISKLRKDARLTYTYKGPQKARGRKRVVTGTKAEPQNFENLVTTEIDGYKVELRSEIVYAVAFKQEIKVVHVKKIINQNKHGEALLFSTDLAQDALQIFQFYTARFQIEFIFRDAKGFTGFTDSQSRNAKRLHYHFNASLTALNVAKIQDILLQKKQGAQRPFSMTSVARQYNVGIVVDRFISMYGLDQTLIKSHHGYQEMLSFANVRY
jgi:hypothetical protein